MKAITTFIYSVLGGAAVGIGGVVFLSVESRVLGSFLFAVGLFTICTFGLGLYTGKICYACDNKPAYLLYVAGVWAGNLVGTVGLGLLIRLTRFGPALAARAAEVSAPKLSDGTLSLFILAVLCNVMIYIAAESYRANPHELGKYLGIVFGVMVFILAGFEHCVANMFYFTVAGAWDMRAVWCLVVVTVGNGVGGILFPLAARLYHKAHG